MTQLQWDYIAVNLFSEILEVGVVVFALIYTHQKMKKHLLTNHHSKRKM